MAVYPTQGRRCTRHSRHVAACAFSCASVSAVCRLRPAVIRLEPARPARHHDHPFTRTRPCPGHRPRRVLAGPEPSQSTATKASTVTPSPVAAAAHADGIAWRKDDVDAAFARPRRTTSRCSCTGERYGARPATRSRRRYSTGRTSSSARAISFRYTSTATARVRSSSARDFTWSGYPTMILFSPDGREIVRLPGEADPEQYMHVLTMGMNGARPVKETLAAALSGKSRRAASVGRRLAHARLLFVDHR